MMAKWCTIVDMGGMGNQEFPPTLRDASLMVHSLLFVHNSSHESFSTTMLLRSVGSTLENVNSLFLEH